MRAAARIGRQTEAVGLRQATYTPGIALRLMLVFCATLLAATAQSSGQVSATGGNSIEKLSADDASIGNN